MSGNLRQTMGRFTAKILPAAVIAAFLVCGCAQPIPPDKREFIGHWSGGGVTLVIAADGGMNYRRVSGASTNEVAGPIFKWEGNNFSVGIPVVNSDFVVSEPPHEEDGKWVMTIEGVRVTRQSE